MPKDRRKATGADRTKVPSPTTKRAAATRSAADKERAIQLLATAKKRDLTTDEYATIRQAEQKRKNDAH